MKRTRRKKKLGVKEILVLVAFVLLSAYYVYLRYQEMAEEQAAHSPPAAAVSASGDQAEEGIPYVLAGSSGRTEYDANGNPIDASNFLVSVSSPARVLPKGFSLDSIPPYRGKAVAVVNNNVPFFTQEETRLALHGSFEYYGDLDALGRCTVAFDCLGRDTMPASGEKRGSISQVRPSGWKQARYDCVDSETVMTRAHLAGFLLSAENANPKNLITGTRYLNTDGMLPYEESTSSYLYKNPTRHVLYRVTPCFRGKDLMADGVLMEAMSVEDLGLSHQYCVYIYNVQPGVSFRYATGASSYTGIFFDIKAGTVVTGGLQLKVFGMDFTSGSIHTTGCQQYAAVPKADRASFYGDLAMKKSWASMGYRLCSACMG